MKFGKNEPIANSADSISSLQIVEIRKPVKNTLLDMLLDN